MSFHILAFKSGTATAVKLIFIGNYMNNNLTEKQKYKIIRPIFSEHKEDINEMPVIKNDFEDIDDWEQFAKDLVLRNYNNVTAKTNNANTLVIMHKKDENLECFWNDPLKYVGLYSGCKAVSTPAFSVTPKMNRNMINYNVFRNRWIGVTWQGCGLKVIPAMQWCDERTLDLCLSGIEYGTPVLISTIGVKKNTGIFLLGFNKIKTKINPPIFIVFGSFIEGMTGNFVFYKYEDAWEETKPVEQFLFEIPKIVNIPEEVQFGK